MKCFKIFTPKAPFLEALLHQNEVVNQGLENHDYQKQEIIYWR